MIDCSHVFRPLFTRKHSGFRYRTAIATSCRGLVFSMFGIAAAVTTRLD